MPNHLKTLEECEVSEPGEVTNSFHEAQVRSSAKYNNVKV